MAIKNKKTIGIVTDEVADLPLNIIEKNQLAIVMAKFDWPEIENLPGENTFQKMREIEKRGIESFGKTSQPSPKNFLDAYRRQLQKFDIVLCLTLTSRLSGTYNSAIQAKNILGEEDAKRVFILDTLNATCGEALVVLKAIDLINEDKDINEIINTLEEIIPRVRFFGILPDPKWLEKSGRMSSRIANWVRKMAQIGVRPLIGIRKGKVTAVGIRTRVKDTPTALFKQLEDETKKLRKKGKKIRVVITHGDDTKEAGRLKEMIKGKLGDNTELAFVNIISNVIGTITGPDTLFCAWCEK